MAALLNALAKRDVRFWDDLSWGTHACLFYETKDDLLDTLIPYFKAGLERNEFCICAIAEPLTEGDLIEALRQVKPDFDRFVASSSIEILPGREWYLEENRFDLERIIHGWNEKLRNALARGYNAMRVSGDAFWLSSNHWKDFCDYESDLNAAIVGKPMSALCTYPLATSRPADILDVSACHQFTIVRRKGDWEVVNAVKVPALTHSLTPRELEVLSWLAKSKTAGETAQILHIAKRTVDEHVLRSVRKLGAANRTHAIAIALQSRVITV